MNFNLNYLISMLFVILPIILSVLVLLVISKREHKSINDNEFIKKYVSIFPILFFSFNCLFIGISIGLLIADFGNNKIYIAPLFLNILMIGGDIGHNILLKLKNITYSIMNPICMATVFICIFSGTSYINIKVLTIGKTNYVLIIVVIVIIYFILKFISDKISSFSNSIDPFYKENKELLIILSKSLLLAFKLSLVIITMILASEFEYKNAIVTLVPCVLYILDKNNIDDFTYILTYKLVS